MVLPKANKNNKMNTIDTNPGTWYCFFCTAPATVTAEIDGEYVTLVVLDSEGKESFCAPAESISVETDGKFRVLPTKASAGASGGGIFHSNLNVGHGASAAVAAVCTLTTGDLGTGGTLADSNGQSVELEAPHKYAVGYASFRDAAEACTLTIGEWSKTWEADPATRAAGWLQLAAGAGTFMVNGAIVNNPEDYTDVEAWNDVLEPCGVFCTDESIETGSPKVNIAAIECGEAGNAITLEAVGEFYSVSGPTLAGGANGRTARDVYNDILADADCPVDVTLDADELGLGFTAREYGVNDTISAEGDMFANWSGMSGGHGDYTVAELVTAIAGEFDDITPAAGETEGTITLTANTAGKAANAITYTATGCFGSGTTRQGSTTHGKDAVEQTDYEVVLNGGAPTPLDLASTAPLKNGRVYTLAVGDGADLSGVAVKPYATCELWIDYSAGSVDVTGWEWVEDPPTGWTAGTRYCIALRNDGAATLASLSYNYTLPTA